MKTHFSKRRQKIAEGKFEHNMKMGAAEEAWCQYIFSNAEYFDDPYWIW